MLCSACTKVIIHIGANDSANHGHHRNIEDLYEASLKNCYICTQLFWNWERIYWETFGSDNTLSAQERERTMVVEVMERQQKILSRKPNIRLPWNMTVDDHLSIRSVYPITDIPGLKTQDISAREPAFSTNGDYFNTSRSGSERFIPSWYEWFFALAPQRVQQYTLPQAYPANQRKGDRWRMNLAQGWLQDCIKNHPQCSPDHSGWRPTRLLQILKSQRPTVKLVLTKQEPAAEHRRPYLTLSHCWGKVSFLTLTTQTHSRLFAGVPLSVLPKTFQDALNMTVFLGFEYIWIDSLCIMQDSINDWNIESSLMGDVYGNGVCNLAATGSADAEGGLWMSRPPVLNLPCEVEQNLPTVSDSRWHIYPRYLQHATLLLDGPLLKRGWVVQERILAHRTLHFGTNQLFWECRHYQICETYPGGLPDTMQTLKSNLVDFHTLRKTFGNEPPEDVENRLANINNFWGQAVRGFSRCQLTKLEDKLVAISGLARKIQERHSQFDFVAGMLRQSLCVELPWEVIRYTFTKDSRRPIAFRAPSWSWSWASVATGVNMMCLTETNRTMSKVLGVEVQEGDDPMGQNISASLRIEGYLMTFTVRYGPEGPGLVRAEFCINGVWYGQYSNIDALHTFRDADEPYRNLHCLVMKDEGKEPTVAAAAQWSWTLSCLLIQRTGLKKGQFKRYGKYEFGGRCYKLSAREDLKNVRNEEWLEFESVGEDGKYIVSII